MYSLQTKENRHFSLWYKGTWHALNQVHKIKHVRVFVLFCFLCFFSWTHNSYLNVSKVTGSIWRFAVSFEWREKAFGVACQVRSEFLGAFLKLAMLPSASSSLLFFCFSWVLFFFSLKFTVLNASFSVPRLTPRCFILSQKLSVVSHWNKATLF